MNIAVIGSGIAGLAAARELAPWHRVTLFEKGRRLGGHVCTRRVSVGKSTHCVDMGFIVFNRQNYPGFSSMLDELQVASKPAPMSFAYSDAEEGVEYNATRIGTLFAQRRNILRPGFFRMVRDILRFYREAPALLESGDPDLTIDEYLTSNNYSREFANWHLLPMTEALWSSPRQQAARFPALALARFMANHGMLQVDNRPNWRVIRGGSHCYVDAWAEDFVERRQGRITLGAQVDLVERGSNGPVLHVDGERRRFDRVVLACHADQSLTLLAKRSRLDTDILGAIRFQKNQVDLHTDSRLMPKRSRCHAAWNVIGQGRASGNASVSYSMNILQGIESSQPLIVTLNRRDDIAPEKRLYSTEMSHPVYDAAMLKAQGRWQEIDGLGGVHFAGAYWGYGFHEDGYQSGVRAASRILETSRGIAA